MDLVGKRIGKYEVLSLLGKGGTAEVYRAMQPALKRQVAIKVLLEEVSDDPDWVRRFELETQLLGTLDHPHILPIYDAGEYEGRPYFVMKYFGEGTTLRELLSGRPWPVAQAVRVTQQIAGALQAAHDAGIVHRDIKPSNILVAPNLHCLVFDFGIAKPSRSRVGNPKTDAGMIVGTPEFMSPEQCKGERLDERSDIYSLGILIYQMLTGHPPFTAETAVGVLMKHITEPLPLPVEVAEVPHPVNRVLARALARVPEDRFTSVTELGEAFARAAEQRDTITLNLSELEDALSAPLNWRQWLALFRSLDVRWWVITTAAFLFIMGAASLHQISASYRPNFLRVETAPAPTVVEPFVLTPVEEEEEEPEPPPAPEPKVTVGRLDIESSEPATIVMNGQPYGASPAVLDGLAPGRYEIRLLTVDGRSMKKDVIVTTGARHGLRFDFAGAGARADARASTTRGLDSGTKQRSTELGGVNRPTSSSPPRATSRILPITIWTGYLTDEDCGIRGGQQGELHLRCAQKCIREGKRPYLYSDGKLFELEGLDRLSLVPGEALRFRGRLHPGGPLEVIAEVENE